MCVRWLDFMKNWNLGVLAYIVSMTHWSSDLLLHDVFTWIWILENDLRWIHNTPRFGNMCFALCSRLFQFRSVLPGCTNDMLEFVSDMLRHACAWGSGACKCYQYLSSWHVWILQLYFTMCLGDIGNQKFHLPMIVRRWGSLNRHAMMSSWHFEFRTVMLQHIHEILELGSFISQGVYVLLDIWNEIECQFRVCLWHLWNGTLIRVFNNVLRTGIILVEASVRSRGFTGCWWFVCFWSMLLWERGNRCTAQIYTMLKKKPAMPEVWKQMWQLCKTPDGLSFKFALVILPHWLLFAGISKSLAEAMSDGLPGMGYLGQF